MAIFRVVRKKASTTDTADAKGLPPKPQEQMPTPPTGTAVLSLDAAIRKASDDLFNRHDADNDGGLKMDECVLAMRELVGPLAKMYVAQFTKLDVDGSGDLNREEVRCRGVA